MYIEYIYTYMYMRFAYATNDAMPCELVQLARPHAMKMTSPNDDPDQRGGGGHKGLTSTNRW